MRLEMTASACLSKINHSGRCSETRASSMHSADPSRKPAIMPEAAKPPVSVDHSAVTTQCSRKA